MFMERKTRNWQGGHSSQLRPPTPTQPSLLPARYVVDTDKEILNSHGGAAAWLRQ